MTSTPAPAARKAVAFLSGAPRLSTRESTESLGPRSHMLGVIGALRQEGYEVEEHIVGNDVPETYGGAGSERRLSSSILTVAAADVLRLCYRQRSRLRLARRARRTGLAFCYERYALVQELGSVLQRRGVPWVLEVNAVLSQEAVGARRATLSGRAATWFEGRTLRRADLVVAVTEALRQELLGRYQLDPARVLVAENGVDPTRFAGTEPWVRSEPTTVGFLGALYPWQQVEQLVRTLPDRPGIRLEVAGEGSARADLEALSADLDVADRVRFLGRLDPGEVPGFLSRCDLLYAGHHLADSAVYFSPLKLWEYLVAGRPVIASRHATTQDLADRGFAVVCFDSGSPDDLPRTLDDALAHLPELAHLAQSQREVAGDTFSWRARLAPIFARADSIASGQQSSRIGVAS